MKYLLCLMLCFQAFNILAQEPSEDLNSRGIDPRVNYNQLWQDTVPIGIPWDDRNLGLVKEDLEVLPAGDFEDTQNIPVWFRILLRRQYPEIRDSGEGQYPRSAAEVYEINWGGEFRTKDYKRGGDPLTVNAEINITGTRSSAESAISINPVNPNLVICGVNGPTGQEMYYSSDGGVTWTRSTSNLSPSCCDPTVGWSPDGMTAYMSQLGTCGALCNIEFFTSTDNGMTWGNRITIRNGQNNDKQYMHIDNSPDSTHRGNIYMHWHKNNTIEFARSIDGGQSWEAAITFNGTRGIGGDVTSNSTGQVFHFWPDFLAGNIRLNTSNDGGATFGAISAIANTNASFDYPIPVFDNRNAFVYLSTDVDLTNGPFRDRIYVCYNDTDGPESGNPANNHSKITILWSSDNGANWNTVTPHPTGDIQTVDRFNPWMEVDENGVIHVAYASTVNAADRRSIDLYHVFSSDGAATWSTPKRVTSTSSPYINNGFQWGDYFGMSVENGMVRPIWTDNRSNVRTYTADADFAGTGGDFAIATANGNTSACTDQTSDAITLDFTVTGGFSDPITLTFDPALPAGLMGSFTGSPVTPPGMATVEFTPGAALAEGNHPVRVVATAGAITHDITLNFVHLSQTIEELAAIWLDTNNFDDNYDFIDNGVIDIADLIDYVNNCQAVPTN